MNLNDSIQVQRLIDGELDIQQIQEMLKDIDSSSEKWKSIATGLIENQLLQSEFVAMEPELASFADDDSRTVRTRHPFPQLWMLSLAASALLTLSLGFLIGSNLRRAPLMNGIVTTENGTNAGNGIVIDSQLADSSGDVPSLDPSVYKMQLQDGDGNRFIDTELPFYQVSNLDDVGRHEFQEYPTDFKNRAFKSGYGIQQDTRFLRGRLNDGRSFVIPVRNTKFSPYQ